MKMRMRLNVKHGVVWGDTWVGRPSDIYPSYANAYGACELPNQ